MQLLQREGKLRIGDGGASRVAGTGAEHCVLCRQRGDGETGS